VTVHAKVGIAHNIGIIILDFLTYKKGREKRRHKETATIPSATKIYLNGLKY
jgi:hypothetical protein